MSGRLLAVRVMQLSQTRIERGCHRRRIAHAWQRSWISTRSEARQHSLDAVTVSFRSGSPSADDIADRDCALTCLVPATPG